MDLGHGTEGEGLSRGGCRRAECRPNRQSCLGQVDLIGLPSSLNSSIRETRRVHVAVEGRSDSRRTDEGELARGVRPAVFESEGGRGGHNFATSSLPLVLHILRQAPWQVSTSLHTHIYSPPPPLLPRL